MTSKERLLAALKFKHVDRVPMMILLGETWLIEKENMSFQELMDLPDLGVDLIVKTYGDLGCDSVTSGLGCWIGCLEAAGCPIEIEKKGAAIEVKPCIIDPEKDVPKLKISDIPAMLDRSPLIKKMMQQTASMKKAVGDSKLVAGQIVGPFSAANMLVGVKEFMVLLGKKSPFLDPILEFTTAFCIEIVRRYREHGADLVQVADPCSSGDLISPRMYADRVVPTLKKLYAAMAEAGYEATMLHVCGKAGMRLPKVMEIGINAFSVDSPVNIESAIAESDGKVCMMGNFDPNGLLKLGSAKEVYDAAMVNLKAAKNSGYVLMPGCDMAAGTPPENIKALVQASIDFSKTL